MEPKYKIGDKVWQLDTLRKAREFTITGARKGITYKEEPTFFYETNVPQLRMDRVYMQIPEEELFTSKEELLASL